LYWPTNTDIITEKPHYKLAYYINLHNQNAIRQLYKLLGILNDGQAVIIIHVPIKKDELYNLVLKYVNSLPANTTGPKSHIHICSRRFHDTPGHSSKLFSQISAYFELLDIAYWDYVINLSMYDWPLRNNNEVHRILQLTPGYSWIDYYIDTRNRF
jgi:hypothetical protein